MTALADLRARVADALTAATVAYGLDDVAVLPDAVDALTPPAYLLVWGSPWMVPGTFCSHVVRLEVVAVAGRMDPAPGIETLETTVTAALDGLAAAGYPDTTVTPPAPFEIGGVRYLAARITIDARLDVTGDVDVVVADVDTFTLESGTALLLETP